jgi:hypothetical protein
MPRGRVKSYGRKRVRCPIDVSAVEATRLLDRRDGPVGDQVAIRPPRFSLQSSATDASSDSGAREALMVEDALKIIADKILDLDEASLVELIPKYRHRMENFEPSREWEASVLIYFIINGFRVKNAQFNERVMGYYEELKKKDPAGGWAVSKPDLRLIKKV